ncbi:hypothetical protein RRG08_051250 [Elysia crispata]|uniref:Uncharacterized protein n=1 Tax=Elysia crispata TaxID=231223 RepID=A0AAE0ZRA6_9GAST|nr:hypothetical protein RRG08_051250 [Elysia crispata]
MSKSGSGKLLRHEDVSDAIISKLLKDFTSAELFPQSGMSTVQRPTLLKMTVRGMKLSLPKHLHVRHPGFKKHRRNLFTTQCLSSLGSSKARQQVWGRSCSQEVRDMEDNYQPRNLPLLQRMLHIPRKMSTMAER